jgi:hypothetical protein
MMLEHARADDIYDFDHDHDLAMSYSSRRFSLVRISALIVRISLLNRPSVEALS